MSLNREPGSMSRKNCRSARVRAGTSARSQPQAALVVPVLSIAYTMWIPFGIGSRIQYTLGPLPVRISYLRMRRLLRLAPPGPAPQLCGRRRQDGWGSYRGAVEKLAG